MPGVPKSLMSMTLSKRASGLLTVAALTLMLTLNRATLNIERPGWQPNIMIRHQSSIWIHWPDHFIQSPTMETAKKRMFTQRLIYPIDTLKLWMKWAALCHVITLICWVRRCTLRRQRKGSNVYSAMFWGVYSERGMVIRLRFIIPLMILIVLSVTFLRKAVQTFCSGI